MSRILAQVVFTIVDKSQFFAYCYTIESRYTRAVYSRTNFTINYNQRHFQDANVLVFDCRAVAPLKQLSSEASKSTKNVKLFETLSRRLFFYFGLFQEYSSLKHTHIYRMSQEECARLREGRIPI
jgi:hypothetical protein